MNNVKNVFFSKPVNKKVTPRPNCKNCFFYLDNNVYEWDSKIGSCTLFIPEVPEKNEYFLNVDECRKNGGICGPDAKYFQQIE